MNKNHVGILKKLSIVIVAMLGLVGIVSINQVDGSAVTGNRSGYVQDVPVHAYAYKLGDARDVVGSVQNNDRITENQREVFEKRQATVKAERIAKEEAEKKALEEQAVVHSETTSNEANAVEEKSSVPVEPKEVKPAQGTASSTSSSNNQQQSAQTQAKAKPAAKQAEPKPAPAPAPAPKPQPKPEPKKPAIGSNKIGINGNFKSYSNYGRASTDALQAGIDSGLIVAGLNNFNGSDGATTYFGGHNPGVMNFMANSIRIGGVITVTDSNGTAFNYKMIDKVDVDEYGEGVLKTIGMSAIDAYMYGTGSESILIQFCNTNNNLMSFWYGVKI